MVSGSGGGLDAEDCPAIVGGDGELVVSEWLTVSSATFTKPLGKDGGKETKKTKGKLGTITVSE